MEWRRTDLAERRMGNQIGWRVREEIDELMRLFFLLQNIHR